jgi:hypothetical protein
VLGTALAALEKQPGLDARDKSILRAFDHWMTVRQAAERLLRSAAWKGPNGKRLDANSIIRVINRKLPKLEPGLERGQERRDHRGWGARLMRRRR